MNEDLSVFGVDPWWLIGIKTVVIFGLLVLTTLMTIWGERKILGRMQHRIGPKYHGPFGLLQSLADGIKLALKEDVVPSAADKVLFFIAPVITVTAAFATFAVIPLGPVIDLPFTDRVTPLQLTDLSVGVLYILAIASVGVYGIVLAGWASGSTYALLGGLRSSAQVISYEIAMGLSLVAVFIYAGTLSTSGIVAAQDDVWFIFILAPSFVIFLVSMVGDTNRAPFDLAEAEGELVGGFHTEYSSLKFALFFLGEYINMVTMSALATTLFLGGWAAPWPLSMWEGANSGLWPMLWFLGKVVGFLFFFIWLRGTLPRMRYDQFMKLGWKVLIPLSLAWIVAVSAVRVVRLQGGIDLRWIIITGVVIALAVLALAFIPEGADPQEGAETEPVPFDAFAGGYPVPPMPGQQSPDLPPMVAADTATGGPNDRQDAGPDAGQRAHRA